MGLVQLKNLELVMVETHLVVTEVAMQGGERHREPDTATNYQDQDTQESQYRHLLNHKISEVRAHKFTRQCALIHISILLSISDLLTCHQESPSFIDHFEAEGSAEMDAGVDLEAEMREICLTFFTS